MWLAIIGDIHGNLPALEAAVQYIDSRGIQNIICTGNLVGREPFTDSVIQLVGAYRIESVQGEYDKCVANYKRKYDSLQRHFSPEELEIMRCAYRNTRSENIEYLRNLNKRLVTSIEGLSICVCHGCPSSPAEPLHEEDAEHIFRRQREYANVHIIACGKPAKPWSRMVDTTLFINPGSIGIPSGKEPEATFAIINTEAHPWVVDFEHIPYCRQRISEERKRLKWGT